MWTATNLIIDEVSERMSNKMSSFQMSYQNDYTIGYTSIGLLYQGATTYRNHKFVWKMISLGRTEQLSHYLRNSTIKSSYE